MVGSMPAIGRFQKIPEIQTLFALTVINVSNPIYTVPAGKKAIIVGFAGVISALGAQTALLFRINTTNLTNLVAAQNIPVSAFIGLVLNAGDTFNILGNNAGAGATVTGSIAVLELPA